MAVPSAKDVAEHWVFVLVAYFLAFGIWTAASGNDFISSSWKSVRHTRRRGQLHVILVFVPMIYMSAYIYYQQKIGDYKETGAASLALAFALLHLVRTIAGLWQLHIFKQWAVASIKSMESLGFETRLPSPMRGTSDDGCEAVVDIDGIEIDLHAITSESNNKDDLTMHDFSDSEEYSSDNTEHSPVSSESDTGSTDESGEVDDGDMRASSGSHCFSRCLEKTSSETEEERIDRQSDEVLVNDTLIDNRLSDVSTTCYPQWLSKSEHKILRQEKLLIKRLLLRVWYSLCSMFRLFNIMLSLTFRKAPRLPNLVSGPRIRPWNPETVWLRWAAALVAQADWMQDLNNKILPSDPDPSADYEYHRDHFAEQILMSAALHSHRTQDGCEGGGTLPGFLAFQDWRKYPQLCRGKFSKQEFLYRACQTGSGLPYMAPHPKAIGSSEGNRRCGYKNFDSELRRACEALPADIEARVSEFSVEKLEWFAIFVSVENWALSDETRKKEETGKPDPDSNSDDRESDAEPQNDIPFENLRKQLGFSKKSAFSMMRFKFPLLRNISPEPLWGNRSILELSCHVDNWLALCAGEHTSYMVEHVPWMDQKCLVESMSKASLDATDGTSDTDCVVKENIELENCKFLCQMAVLVPEDAHFEKSMSFLGCSMEMLRSSLAKWAENAGDQDEHTWKPAFPSAMRTVIDPFKASDDLTACLRSTDCISHLTDRYIQMRVLWEVQNQLHRSLPKDGAAPSSAAAIVLCVLSFPALSIDIREARCEDDVSRIRERRAQHCIIDLYPTEENKYKIEDYEYVIRASCGPQNVSAIVSFGKFDETHELMLSVRFCNDEESPISVFQWQAWRDCFYGRLEGSRQWQGKLGLAYIPLLPTVQNIWTGMKKSQADNIGAGAAMSVWKGWIPPRATISMYEMATPGFIMEAVQTKGVDIDVSMSTNLGDTFTVPREIWMPVGYETAKVISLKHASLVGHDLLKSEARGADATVIGLKDTMTKAEQRRREMNDDSGLALLMLELSAMEKGNAAALEKAVGYVLGTGCTGNSIAQAVSLLERFYFSKSSKSNIVSLDRFFNDDERVKVVQSLFDELFVKSKYDHMVAERYLRFLLAMSEYREKNLLDSARTAAFKFLVFRGHLRETTKAAFAISDFSRTLGIEIYEEFAAQYLACKNLMAASDIAQADNIPGYSIRRWKEVKAETMSDLGLCIAELCAREEAENTLLSLRLDLQAAVELHERAIAEEYYEEALIYLANLLLAGGKGLEQNVYRALKLYQQAIEEKGSIDAMQSLADNLTDESFIGGKDVVHAARIFERAIEDGKNVDAMRILASVLSSAAHGCQDIPGSIRLYERAIEDHGSVNAMERLADLLQSEMYGVQDIRRAIELYERAIEDHGSVNAMEELADLLRSEEYGVQDIRRSIQLYERAIEDHGSDNAMERLADLLRSDEYGVQDIRRAIQLYERAIKDHGSVNAMGGLAFLLQSERYGVQDILCAIQLYERAIEDHGSLGAMRSLAYLLESEEYGVQDISRAMHLYQRCIEEEKFPWTITSLADRLESDLHGARDLARSAELYDRAIRLDPHDWYAMERLAVILEAKEHGMQDVPRAARLYQRAIDRYPDYPSYSCIENLAALLKGAEHGLQDVHRAALLYERAIEIYSDEDAMERLGEILEEEESGMQDVVRATDLYGRARDGCATVENMNKLALLLQKGKGKDLSCAAHLYELSIHKWQDKSSMRLLALLLQRGGEGVGKDVARAVQLCEMAIERGCYLSLVSLGDLLEDGDDGVKKDLPRARELYASAATVHKNTYAEQQLALLDY